jgi:hypothetical protein
VTDNTLWSVVSAAIYKHMSELLTVANLSRQVSRMQSSCVVTEVVLEERVSKMGDKYFEQRINIKFLFKLGKTSSH